MTLLVIGGALVLVGGGCAALLVRDVTESRLRARVSAVRAFGEPAPAPAPVRAIGLRPADERGKLLDRMMRMLRLNPEIAQQNVIAWKLVIALAVGVALIDIIYGHALLGWPLALLLGPVEAFIVARLIFGWERARYQKALLEQIPDVMAMICRAIGAGVPLAEALRSVAKEAPSPSQEEFVLVTGDVAIGQPLERALWKLQNRTGLPEYAFFAVTISLQAQTGGNLVETLHNLQDLVRKRVAMSKRGKALASEARFSGLVLSGLPFFMGFVLYFVQPGFIKFFFYTEAGNHLLMLAFGLLAAGTLVMRQMIQRTLAP